VALLTKTLDFRPLLTAGLVSSVVSGGIAILLALAGAGVWSLAAQILASAVVTTTLLWLLHPWRPELAWSADSARRLGGFGGYVFAANLSDVVFTRSYTLLVGKLYGARDVGIYSRADSTQQLPVDMLNTIFGRVALPVFSESAGNRAALRAGARTATNSLMLLNVPLLLGVAVVAEPLVRILFGDAWSDTVPLLQILCLAGTLWPLHVINLQVLLAEGRSRLFLRLEVAKKLIGLVLLALASTFGLAAIAWSQVVFGLIAFLINAHYSRRFLDYGAVAQLRDVVPIFVAAVPSVVVGLWIIRAWDASAVAEILVVLPVCAVGFALMALVLKLRGVGTLTGLVRSTSGKDAES
jgi:O-antigen/teichoic acid export membrane protein